LKTRAAVVETAMKPMPPAVADFFSTDRIAVAGVSRDGRKPANAVFRKLRDGGFDVVALNPDADEVEGAACYPDLRAVPGRVDALMVVTPPQASEGVVRQAAARGIRRVWFHRSFGQGSVSAAALAACAELGIEPIVGGCPLMYLAPVDPPHRCLRWWLARHGRVPA
jgi:predicted CoA-binding protein